MKESLMELSAGLENTKLSVEGKVAVITMARPKAMNALSNQTLEELRAIFTAVSKESEILGVVITGEGKAFIAGADISQMKDYGCEEGREYTEQAQSLFNQIERLEKPVIAAVNGFALGGGCELSMACDIRIASEKAIFGQPEVAIGLIPCFGGTQRLPRYVGPGMAKEMIYTGRQISAQEAKELGLVNKVVEADGLMDAAMEMMAVICQKAPLAVRYAKIAINRSMDMDLTSGLELEKDLAGIVFATEDKKEGLAAFLGKRPAEFQNK